MADGKVLDFGAGTSPYREYVAGEYLTFEKDGDPNDLLKLELKLDAILCTQVLQYIVEPQVLMRQFLRMLKPGGYLVMTYPTNWDEVEPDDFWRFTKAGVDHMLKKSTYYMTEQQPGRYTSRIFEVMVHERRAEVELNGFRFPLGYGLVAKSITGKSGRTY